MKYTISLALPVLILLLTQCNQPADTGNKATQTPTAEKKPSPPEAKRTDISYTVQNLKDSIRNIRKRYSIPEQLVLASVNRTDTTHLPQMDSIIVPDNLQADAIQYYPFPFDVPSLKEVRKIIFFSYPSQTFGAYENGKLVYAGPTNMGRKKDPTPTGLLYTNWKAEDTKSTFNDEWDLKWNFNVENKEGIGWHEYAMPGYPASHSCLRLQEGDAQYLYKWADEWVLRGKDSVVAKGTPVMIFGAYPFGQAKPWFALAGNAHALDISVGDLDALVKPHIDEILAEQQKQATHSK